MLSCFSYDTVRPWIQGALDGKNNLQLGQPAGKWQVANTTKNHKLMEKLAASGRRHRTRRALKRVEPQPEFYTLYSPAQQRDILASIETHKEIPFQYNYFAGGVKHWVKYEQRLLNEEDSNSLKHTIELIEANLPNIDRFVGDRKVNVIDLGVGNAFPVKGLLRHLLERGVLGRYVGVDISPDMLRMAESNISEWFAGQVPVSTHVLDMATESFKTVLGDDYLETEGSRPINLFLLLGGTILNFRHPQDVLRHVNVSMSADDMFICTNKLDTVNSRRCFDFNADEEVAALAAIDRVAIDLLGIEPSMYTPEQFYDEESRSRLIRIRMNLDVSIRFSFAGKERLLELSRNDTITLWRAWHYTDTETTAQLSSSGFSLLETSITSDREYFLTLSGIAKD